jgi:hypothetical protein
MGTEADAEAVSAVMTAFAHRRWDRKTKAEKLAHGRALTAARMVRQGKVRATRAKKPKRK